MPGPPVPPLLAASPVVIPPPAPPAEGPEGNEDGLPGSAPDAELDAPVWPNVVPAPENPPVAAPADPPPPPPPPPARRYEPNEDPVPAFPAPPLVSLAPMAVAPVPTAPTVIETGKLIAP